MFDLVVRGGTVVDGTGADPVTADVAITDGVIVAVGPDLGEARREIDATGAIVTPGFVDIHTHYDGQATWDPYLTPSCWHGVTTVVMGNCGVGFAPVKPDRHEWLIGLMEGVEDIPGAALSVGIDWRWESFPEFLDALERTPRVMDIATQVPHGAVRAYVMGERGASNQPATAEDIDAMAAIVREGIEAGALGFSTSRTLAHRAIDGEPVPGTFAAEDELFGIGAVLGELGTGVFELAPAGALGEDLVAPDKEVDWMVRLSKEIGRPVSFALDPEQRRSGAVAPPAGPGRRRPRGWRPGASAGPRSDRVVAVGAAHVPPGPVHCGVGRAGHRLVGPRRPGAQDVRTCRARPVARRTARPRRRRGGHGVHEPGEHLHLG